MLQSRLQCGVCISLALFFVHVQAHSLKSTYCLKSQILYSCGTLRLGIREIRSTVLWSGPSVNRTFATCPSPLKITKSMYLVVPNTHDISASSCNIFTACKQRDTIHLTNVYQHRQKVPSDNLPKPFQTYQRPSKSTNAYNRTDQTC